MPTRFRPIAALCLAPVLWSCAGQRFMIESAHAVTEEQTAIDAAPQAEAPAAVPGAPERLASASAAAARSLLAQAPAHKVITLGTGCTGSGGFVPELALLLEPAQGSALRLEVRKGLGGADAVVVVGASRAGLGLIQGCLLAVAPGTQTICPVRLSGSGPGLGKAQVSAALPQEAKNGVFAAQAFVRDPAAADGYAGSRVVEVTVR